MRKSLIMTGLAIVLATGAATAHAGDLDHVIGGAVGGAAGAAIGQSVGGRDGAIVGGAIGAATGVILTQPTRERVVVRPVAQPVYVYERDYRPARYYKFKHHKFKHHRHYHDRGHDHDHRRDWRD
ncbi:glycine zipper domain-containing protein [Vogesella alkaliphila]|uniref:Glycine zipper domain-containing protein n=1 Tax=Vogesella alkaliphila TaxID=1193621 RepID=A0ABQ2YG45_9NEIS|nr:glycine zipper domain-containing protein [Vogesella alkaliphila]GGX80600.1 hypothetical protein GCM10011290_05390 [Vogesella alkaliphila]